MLFIIMQFILKYKKNFHFFLVFFLFFSVCSFCVQQLALASIIKDAVDPAWESDLIPGMIGVAPKAGPPLMIELVQRFIFILQPKPEPLFTFGAIAGPCNFIIDMP